MPKTSNTSALPHRSDSEIKTYSQSIRRPLNQLLLILPLLLFFQIFSAQTGSRLLVPEYMRAALESFGATGRYLPALLIVAVLLFQHFTHKDPHRPNLWAPAGMIVESAMLTLPLLAINWITNCRALPAAVGATESPGLVSPAILEAVGAGVYEEFLFRLFFFGVAALLLIDLLQLPKKATTIGIILVSGVIFSMAHFSAAQWLGPETLDWHSFAFLATAGIWWGVLFIWRGYGVAAASHIWWNLLVVMMEGKF
ncbi:MAG: CPBP family intramembrane metalloprotease [Phycisphaerae bacterium]|nr:CPBP family intramembrane metalloprotease [Phycisphaerae bacterium]